MASQQPTKKTEPKKVSITTVFDNSNEQSIIKRLERYKTEKGLPYVQDVVRLAVANFLDKAGY